MDEKNVKDVPVYPYSSAYASETVELQEWRNSRRADAECRKAIDRAISEQWDGAHLPDSAAKGVIEKFGAERVAYVLADALQQRGEDGRFSNANETWAGTMPMFSSKESRWASPVQSHPVKLDEFVTLARRDMGELSMVAERAKELRAIPLYRQSYDTAMERGEGAQYWASLDANVACKEAIESAIARHYRNNSLGDAGAKEVVAMFGFERTFHVLASTVRHQDRDGRISADNKAWAASQPPFDAKDPTGRDLSFQYLVDRSGSPGLTDLFLNQVRHDYALFQEQERGAEKTPERTAAETERQTKLKDAQRLERCRKTPIYLKSFQYAWEHGEADQHSASREVSIACCRAIGKAISENYHDNRLSKAGAQSVLQDFGAERVSHVLAQTLLMKPNDGRFSYRNRQWAATIPTQEDGKNCGYGCGSHPALLDLFIDQTREEILLRTPLTRNDIKAEAQSILTQFRRQPEPNSQDGARFEASVSPEFMKRAKPKDMERLRGMLPFASLTISEAKTNHEAIAAISRDEDRSQKLVLRKPSIRKQLAEKPPEKETPAVKPRSKEASL